MILSWFLQRFSGQDALFYALNNFIRDMPGGSNNKLLQWTNHHITSDGHKVVAYVGSIFFFNLKENVFAK